MYLKSLTKLYLKNTNFSKCRYLLKREINRPVARIASATYRGFLNSRRRYRDPIQLTLFNDFRHISQERESTGINL